MISKSM